MSRNSLSRQLMSVLVIAAVLVPIWPQVSAAQNPPVPTDLVYLEAFEQFDANLNAGAGRSTEDNFNGALGWGESYIMMSYLAMYRATGEPDYLRRLTEHADNVLAQRDDNAGRIDYLGQSNATWVATRYTVDNAPYGWLVHSGMITYPLADFAQLVINDPDLHGIVGSSGRTFLETANYLVAEVDKTVAVHESQWDPVEEMYRFPDVPVLRAYRGELLPYNMATAMGRTHLAMFEATGSQYHLDRAAGLARHFMSNVRHDPVTDSYEWNYIGVSSASEDFSHSSIESDFARLAYEQGIVVTATDMERFANTFTERFYIGPANFRDRIVSDATNKYTLAGTSRWIGYSTVDPDIYNIISDVWFELALAGDSRNVGYYFLAIANLHRYRNVLEPVATHRVNQPREMGAVTMGDLDGDGTDEVFVAHNSDGRLDVHDHNDRQMPIVASSSSYGPASAWAGAAAGDFDGDGVDEVVAVRNFDGRIAMLELAAGTLREKAFLADPAPGALWAGIAAGDFDRDGLDEFVAVNNSNGDFYVYELNGNQIERTHLYTGFGSGSAWAGLAAGDFDDDGVEEYAAIRNFDSLVLVFKLQDDGAIATVASTRDLGVFNDWNGLAAGDFDGDGRSELIASRDADGDHVVVGLRPEGDLAIEYTVPFISSAQDGLLAAGTPRRAGQYNDEVLVGRNVDGDLTLYEMSGRLPAPQPFGDVNCDGRSNVVDSLLIAQFDVGLRTAIGICPLPDPVSQINTVSADVTTDNTIDVIDALTIARCDAGLVTPFC